MNNGNAIDDVRTRGASAASMASAAPRPVRHTIALTAAVAGSALALTWIGCLAWLSGRLVGAW
jgi:hypothetical protein